MSAPRPVVGRRVSHGLLWLLCLGPLALRAAFAHAVELTPDEAYYAAWADHLAASYFDHPPLVAWWMASGQALLGPGELGVRLPGLLLGAALPWLLYGAARALGASRWSSLWATAAASSTLLCSAGAVIVTPDTLLSLACALATFGVAHLLARGPAAPLNRWPLWLTLAGFAAALASKLTGVLLLGQALLLPGLGPARRRAPLALAALGLAPVLAWNAAQGWPMFAFHAARVGDGGFRPNYALEFLAAQLALLNLGPGLLVAAACVRGLRASAPLPLRAMTLWTLGPLCATAALALCTKVEANWIAPAFLPAFVATALWLDTARLSRRWVAAATAFAALTTLLAHAHVVTPFLPLPEGRDPSAQLRGGRALADAVRAERDRLGPELPVLTSRYQEAALLGFYLPDPRVTTLPSGPRRSQYDLWPAPGRDVARALCVHREGEAPAAGRRLVAGGQVYYLRLCRPATWRAAAP